MTKEPDIVTVVCYGRTEKMERRKAAALYKQGMLSCEGPESRRYMNLWAALTDRRKPKWVRDDGIMMFVANPPPEAIPEYDR